MVINIEIVAPCRGWETGGDIYYKNQSWTASRFFTSRTIIDLPVPEGAAKMVFSNPWSSAIRFATGSYFVDIAYTFSWYGDVTFYDKYGYEIGVKGVNLPEPESTCEIDVPAEAYMARVFISSCRPSTKVVNASGPANVTERAHGVTKYASRCQVIQFKDAAGNVLEEYQLNATVVFWEIPGGRFVFKIPGKTSWSTDFSNIGDYIKYLGFYIYKAYNLHLRIATYDSKDRLIKAAETDIDYVATETEILAISDEDIESVINPDTGNPYTWKDVAKIELELDVLDKSKTALWNAEMIFQTKRP